MFTISIASKSNTLAPCNSFSNRMSNSTKNAWLESSFPSISGWPILTLWVIPSVTLHIWWKLSTHWGNICTAMHSRSFRTSRGYRGDQAAWTSLRLRTIRSCWASVVRTTQEHRSWENTDDDLCLFLFQDTQKTHLKQPYIYIHILIYDLIAQKQSFHSVSVTLRWVPCPS